MNESTEKPIKVALTGNVALELVASYFRDAGYEVMPQDVPLDVFKPDFVYDVTAHDEILATEIDGFFDPRLEKLAGCRYSRAGLQALVEEFTWFVKSPRSGRVAGPRKILAVDADNTLWRGILSEDGAANLKPCAEFQAGLRRLKDEGALLVLLSKNDPFELDWMTCSRVNWSPKAGNLLDVCRTLNLSPDAVVFVDDNAHERAQMAAHLPDVAVAPWTGWPGASDEEVPIAAQCQLIRRLHEYFFFDLGRTDEDRLRAADYTANARRDETRLFAASTEDYLKGLGLYVRPSRAAETDLDRLAQMAGKTNQFNATTLRRSRADFAAILHDPMKRLFVFRAGDRFGEQGLVCYILVDLSTRRITDFVMSCRAMGRTLEQFALLYVERQMGYRPEIDFIPTAKNRPFAEFRDSVRSESFLRTYFSEVAN